MPSALSGRICGEVEREGSGEAAPAGGWPARPAPGLTLRRPMVCTHSMVRTSNTSTPYSLYTVTWEGLQPSAHGAKEVSDPRARPHRRGAPAGATHGHAALSLGLTTGSKGRDFHMPARERTFAASSHTARTFEPFPAPL